MADSTSNSSSWSISGDPAVTAAALNYMNQTFNWGLQQFANVSQLTDQVVGDMLNLYGQLSGVGNDLMGQYKNLFMPEYQNLVQDANNYSSQARIQQAMGAAESGVAQNFNSQRNAALASLQSFGIDPSSGRYAALDQTERLQQAAAQAGAGFQAEQATEATGRALRSEALQLGSVMPSQATAAYNAAGQAAGAGANIKMATAQLGSNLLGRPTDWAKIAQEGRQGGSSGSSKGNKGDGSNTRSNQPDAYDTRPPTPDKTWDYQGANQPGGGGAGGGPGPGDLNLAGLGGGGPGIINYKEPLGPDEPPPLPPARPPEAPPGPDRFDNPEDIPSGPTAGEPGSNAPEDLGNLGPDENGNQDSGPGNLSNFDPTAMQNANDANTFNYDNMGNDQGGGSDTGGGNTDFQASDTPDNSENDFGFARGGAIPYSKSPSHGRVTDDVAGRMHPSGEPIRVNAGEFIIPRYAREWYGDKYLQGLINKAKDGQQTATAKPTLKPPLPSQRGAIPSSRHAA